MPISSIHAKAMQRPKRYQRFFLPGTDYPPDSPFHDFVQQQYEHDKRNRLVVAGPSQELPQRAVLLARDPIIPRPETIIDRLHKWSSHYVVVSSDHNAGEDPIPNPGYRSAGAVFSTVQDGYDYAKNYLQPLLGAAPLAAGKRVKLFLLGGYYEEDVNIGFDDIDIIGLGRPTIYGNMNIANATVPTRGRLLLQDLEIRGKLVPDASIPALTIGTTFDYPTASNPALVEIDRCWIHSVDGAIRSASRLGIYRSVVETDANSDLAPIISVNPALKITNAARGWSEIWDSWISGVIDHRAAVGVAGYPNKSYAIWARNPAPYIPYGDTGVMVRRSTVLGYVRNECWQLYFGHCDLYAGKKHATAGDMFSFTQGDSTTGIIGRTWFDHSMVACRYIGEVADMTFPTVANPCPTKIYVQFTKQLAHPGDWAGASIQPGNVVFNLFGFSIGNNGITYAIKSSTFREYWEFNGAESAIMTDCDTGLVLSANANMGVAPFGPLLQTILENPYAWRY
jgi:hypothetical protein